MVSESDSLAASDAQVAQMDARSAEAKEVLVTQGRILVRLTIIAAVVLLLIAITASLVYAEKIVRPINEMSRHIQGLNEDDPVFTMRPIYETKDEVEELAKAFATLSGRTVEYIEQVRAVTAEKERISSELSVATKIQADMLPCITPVNPGRKEVRMAASMSPAKEVGGDFYDFFMIGEDKLGLVMADVSGKGVPAALFMVISKTMLKDRSLMGGTPATILTEVNNLLVETNKEDLFVTVWMGILDLNTGLIRAASAGHEYPAVRRAGGSYELFKDPHGFVLGTMEEMKYEEYELKLEKGDSLFLYTDGVPEATNAQEELFTTDRMLDALNRNPDADPDEILQSVRYAVDGFVGEADPFDDLTMMSIKYLG